jgi:hypothetical protein
MFKLKNLNAVEEMIEDDIREKSHNAREAFLQLDMIRNYGTSYANSRTHNK